MCKSPSVFDEAFGVVKSELKLKSISSDSARRALGGTLPKNLLGGCIIFSIFYCEVVYTLGHVHWQIVFDNVGIDDGPSNPIATINKGGPTCHSDSDLL